MTRLPATVSVDLDPVDLHLVGYGHAGLPPDPLVYDVAVPRLLESFARHGVRATWFVVGRDAGTHRDAIGAIAAAGHEVASHSMSHPMALARMPRARQVDELAESKRALEAASGGAPVIGFRAPNFDFDRGTAATLRDAGYRYDASGYPTPALAAARLVLALKGRDLTAALRLALMPIDWSRHPHALANGLCEFPVSVTPIVRFPVYHTARYAVSDAWFARLLDGFARRREPLSYPLHAVDALGLAEDRVDERLARHPGMGRPLAAKRDLLDRSLAAIAERFEPATFAERLASDAVDAATAG